MPWGLTIYIKAKIDNTGKNNKCRLCGDRWNSKSDNKWRQQIGAKGIQDKAWMGRKGDPLGIVQEIEFWPY